VHVPFPLFTGAGGAARTMVTLTRIVKESFMTESDCFGLRCLDGTLWDSVSFEIDVEMSVRTVGRAYLNGLSRSCDQ
jgi:hypothetical protein